MTSVLVVQVDRSNVDQAILHVRVAEGVVRIGQVFDVCDEPIVEDGRGLTLRQALGEPPRMLGPVRVALEVCQISSYRRSLTELHSGMTGQLDVTGSGLDDVIQHSQLRSGS
jgi:hypothetical protein